jgi:hypothetical protein
MLAMAGERGIRVTISEAVGALGSVKITTNRDADPFAESDGDALTSYISGTTDRVQTGYGLHRFCSVVNYQGGNIPQQRSRS